MTPMKHTLPRRGFVSAAVAGTALLLGVAATSLAQSEPRPPIGFTALFNGRDLMGWRGGDTFDYRKLMAMPEAERSKMIEKWTASMHEVNPKTGKPHWYVEDGELVNDGFGAYASTDTPYGDFEFMVDYKTVPKADSGIYLRGVPQIQIWDHTEADPQNLGRAKGSGGLWNNSPGKPGKDPLVLADKPFGEWNSFRTLMVGSRVSVWLNGQAVVDHAILENYYDRKVPVPATGPIRLQTHGGEIRWRNIFLRPIAGEEANSILSRKGEEPGFTPIFNGKDFTGWDGPLDNYEIVDGAIRCKAHKGGTIFTKEQYGDFVVRLEFKVPPGGNNGLAIRYPGSGDTAYAGMCELQVLDENYETVTKSKLDPRQVHGSAYGMLPAHRGYQRPAGEWNFQEVKVQGSRITVELNGTVILDGDVGPVKEFMANSPHPGKDRTMGHFGFAGHSDPVSFRNIRIRKL
jgi:hypothetical protein